jgi:predicted esterase
VLVVVSVRLIAFQLVMTIALVSAGCVASVSADRGSTNPGRETQSAFVPAEPEQERATDAGVDERADGDGDGDGVEGEYRSLRVPGYLPAVLYVPASSGAAPLVVAAHGAGGDPEGECEYWRALTHGRSLVMCLRGRRISRYYSGSYYYPTHIALGRELSAAMRALRATPDVTIPKGPHVYAGFSQGAIMGAIMIVDQARAFPWLALIEGGFQYWNIPRARRFKRNGGRRVLFVCGTAWCANGARQTAAWLRGAGVQVRLEHAPFAGHTPGGAVEERTRAALPWLLNEEPEDAKRGAPEGRGPKVPAALTSR